MTGPIGSNGVQKGADEQKPTGTRRNNLNEGNFLRHSRDNRKDLRQKVEVCCQDAETNSWEKVELTMDGRMEHHSDSPGG